MSQNHHLIYYSKAPSNFLKNEIFISEFSISNDEKQSIQKVTFFTFYRLFGYRFPKKLNEGDILLKDFYIPPYKNRENPFHMTEKNFVRKKISKNLSEISIPTARTSK